MTGSGLMLAVEIRGTSDVLTLLLVNTVSVL